MAGYHFSEGMPWIDSFANAAMILSGMDRSTRSRRLAANCSRAAMRLYSGLLLIVATGIVLAPLLHRMLHVFHVEPEEKKKDGVANQ